MLIRGGKPGYGWDGGDYPGHLHDAYTVQSNPHLAGVAQFYPPCVVAKFELQEDGTEAWRFAEYDGGFYGLWQHPTEWCEIP
ncbi:hypothetical protein [Novosphingobium huizhouense]|uniref:hypothetical protein n=1 Tax=Novosphingobium huizhouense TaxID=2866625 RepID=UPI001CD87635|nr:hypothetical protein [Novosphingobium huizhouense]